MSAQKTILLISSELWGNYFLSKHHYAYYLSKNHKVYYVNPVNISWTTKEVFQSTIVTDRISENLSVISYANPVPKLELLPWLLRSYVFKELARRIKKKLNLDHIDILWSFDFTRFNDHSVWRAHKTLLHVVEVFDHPHFNVSGRFKIRSVKTADLIVSIADKITEQLKPHVSSKLVQINHGADIEGFQKVEANPINLPGTHSLKACFVGNFQYSFDFDLLQHLALSNRLVDFIIIAPLNSSTLGKQSEIALTGIQKLHALSNIHLIGGVPSNEIMRYLLNVDINLILYKDENAFGHVNPHKMMGYFYAGKVIISSLVDEYKNRKDLIAMAKTNTEIPAIFKEVVQNISVHNTEEQQNHRRQFAIQNDYARNVERILGYLK